MRVVRIVLSARVIELLLLMLNQVQRSNRIQNHLFVCKFERNIETIGRFRSMRTCESCTHHFEYESDRITPFDAKQSTTK